MTTNSQRLTHLTSAVPGSAKVKLTAKHDDDVVIVSALRTAITKVGPVFLSVRASFRLHYARPGQSRKGGFKDTLPEEMLSAVLRAVYSTVSLDPALIEDVVVGNVLPPAGGASAARMASLHAGIPNTSAVNTVNRQCSSGLTAVNQVAMEIIAGQIDIGIGSLVACIPGVPILNSGSTAGAGVESMTHGYGAAAMPQAHSEVVLANQEAADCLIPMGITSENVAAQYNITREVQDDFAAKSFQKAVKAQVCYLMSSLPSETFSSSFSSSLLVTCPWPMCLLL